MVCINSSFVMIRVARRFLNLSACQSQNGLPWSIIKPYGSIRVNLTEAVDNGWTESEDFPDQLKRHAEEWRVKGHSAIWLYIPIPLSRLISVVSEQGFTLHHGNEKEVLMTKWLQEGRINRLPRYASHQVGVCGVVLREDTDEILVTQDKYKPPIWKFPGGISDFGEDIGVAAVREVREETGILSEFKSILAFRQQHRLRRYFGLSDLYFICRLSPLTFNISRCEDEILKCRWMGLDELARSHETTPLSHRVAQLLVEARVKGLEHFDITMQEIDFNFPDYADTKSYKLFMRSS